MAYIDQAAKKIIATKLAPILQKHGLKGSLSIRHHSTLILTLKSGMIDFGAKTLQINQYHYQNHLAKNENAVAAIRELFAVMNEGNYDHSDIMTDYFCVGYYVDIRVGTWEKDYVCTGETIESIKADIARLQNKIAELQTICNNH